MSHIIQGMSTYTLKELEDITGFTGRVIRDYIAKGYLPGPVSRGRNAAYDESFLMRLKCLQILRQSTPREFTLEMLADVMNSLTASRIEDIASGKESVRAVTLDSSGNKFSGPEALRSTLTSSATDSALGNVSERLASLIQPASQRRQSRTEHWVSVSITKDIEIRARNLPENEVAHLESLAEALHQLLLKN